MGDFTYLQGEYIRCITDLLTIDPNFQPHSIHGTGIFSYMKSIKNEASM